MKRQYKAIIKWQCKKNHPDTKDTKTVFEYDDTYTIDDDYFYGEDDIIHYIKHDMALAAGGGYSTDTIKNVKINITRI